MDILEKGPKEDVESLFRALVASEILTLLLFVNRLTLVGTLLYDDSSMKRHARGTNLLRLIGEIKTNIKSVPEKVQQALQDLDIILK